MFVSPFLVQVFFVKVENERQCISLLNDSTNPQRNIALFGEFSTKPSVLIPSRLKDWRNPCKKTRMLLITD